VILVTAATDMIPKSKETFRLVYYLRQFMSISSPKLILLKIMFVLFATIFTVAHAEEFGVARRVPVEQTHKQPSQQILPYVVRIIAFDSSGQSFGTGSYIGTYGEYGVILTNWHVVSLTSGLVHVHFPSGFSSFGARISGDEKWDLALIVISKPPQSVPMLTIAQTPAKKDEPLWIVGWGSGSYRIAGGHCVRYMAREKPTDGSDPLFEIIEVSVSARKGDSGGPILNQKGELAGVLFGSDMIRHTAGSYSGRVNQFLVKTQNEMAGLPERPESYFALIEKDGPLHKLRDSRNAVPQTVEEQRTDFSGTSVPSFGIRSSSRRYAPPIEL